MKNFLIKYKFHIICLILFIVFIRSCGKSRDIKRLEKTESYNIEVVDSLQTIINVNKSTIDSIPEILRKEKLSIYLSLDDTISRVDRTPQLMGFHAIIKDKIKDLQK
jgi:hypothetical protein